MELVDIYDDQTETPLHHQMDSQFLSFNLLIWISVVLSYCKNLPFIEQIEIDSDEEHTENVEETSRGDSDDELIDKVNIVYSWTWNMIWAAGEQFQFSQLAVNPGDKHQSVKPPIWRVQLLK